MPGSLHVLACSGRSLSVLHSQGPGANTTPIDPRNGQAGVAKQHLHRTQPAGCLSDSLWNTSRCGNRLYLSWWPLNLELATRCSKLPVHALLQQHVLEAAQQPATVSRGQSSNVHGGIPIAMMVNRDGRGIDSAGSGQI